MTEFEKLEQFMANVETRVEEWGDSQREAFYESIGKECPPRKDPVMRMSEVNQHYVHKDRLRELASALDTDGLLEEPTVPNLAVKLLLTEIIGKLSDFIGDVK